MNDDTEEAPPPAPANLGPRGAALWQQLTGALTFDPHEVELLERACELTDRLDQLDAAVARDGVMIPGSRGAHRLHPAIAEHRASTLALARVLVALRLPAGYAGEEVASAPKPQRRVGVRGFYAVPRGA